MINLSFMTNDNAQLTPECEAELFRGIDWKEEKLAWGDGPNKIFKRLVTATVTEEDAVAFSGTLFFGHVLISQEQHLNIKEEVVGRSTNIVPMDDAKFKSMVGRSGYYGTGSCNLGSNPTQ